MCTRSFFLDVELPQAAVGHLVVRGESVRSELRSWRRVRLDEGHDAGGGAISDPREPDASDPMLSVRFDSCCYPQLVGRTAAATALEGILIASSGRRRGTIS